MAKVSMALYEMPNDISVTPLSTELAACGKLPETGTG
jgi:hypothetical protein